MERKKSIGRQVQPTVASKAAVATVAAILVSLVVGVLHSSQAALAASERGSNGSSLAIHTIDPTITLSETTQLYLPFINNPARVREPEPSNGEPRASVNANLLWNDPGAPIGTVYSVFLEAEDTTPDVRFAAGVERRGVDPPELALDTQYYWQVIAHWPDGRSVPGPIWTFHTEAAGLEPDTEAMIYIGAGSFMQGCDRANPTEYASWGTYCTYTRHIYHQAEPLRSVWLSSFHIDKYEVTNQEYRACMEAGACNKPRRTEWFDDPEYALAPVTFVSWWDATDYCAWESKRLPTEAEWEKAARGTLDTRTFPWGNQWPTCDRVYQWNVAYGCPDRGRTVTQVGSFPTGASPYGVHDMSANVFEWVQDKHDVFYYNYAPNVDPPGPPYARVSRDRGDPNAPLNKDEQPVFSIKGGSWKDPDFYMRVSHRHWAHHGDYANDDIPLYRSNRLGFRCAVSR